MKAQASKPKWARTSLDPSSHIQGWIQHQVIQAAFLHLIGTDAVGYIRAKYTYNYLQLGTLILKYLATDENNGLKFGHSLFCCGDRGVTVPLVLLCLAGSY